MSTRSDNPLDDDECDDESGAETPESSSDYDSPGRQFERFKRKIGAWADRYLNVKKNLGKVREHWPKEGFFEGLTGPSSAGSRSKLAQEMDRKHLGAKKKAEDARAKKMAEDAKKAKEEAEEAKKRQEELERNEQATARATRAALEAARFETGAEGEQEPPDPSALKKMIWYHKSYMRGLVSTAERNHLGTLIDGDEIEQGALAAEAYVEEKCKKHTVVLLGESATCEGAEKQFFASAMEVAKKSGITDIGLEIEDVFQKEIDQYLQTGSFTPQEQSRDYEKLVVRYQELRRKSAGSDDKKAITAIHELEAFQRTVQNQFLFHNGLAEYFPILKKARELGMRVHCIDGRSTPSVDDRDSDNALRDEALYYGIRRIHSTGVKLLVLADGARLARKEKPYKNLGDLLAGNKAIDSFQIHLDRNFDADADLRRMKVNQKRTARPLNTVLFTVLQEWSRQRVTAGEPPLSRMGVDMYSRGGGADPTPFDGYMKIE